MQAIELVAGIVIELNERVGQRVDLRHAAVGDLRRRRAVRRGRFRLCGRQKQRGGKDKRCGNTGGGHGDRPFSR